MYLYFDVNGNLKEIINYPIREGDDNVNKIYIYMERSEDKCVVIPQENYDNYNFESEPIDSEVRVFMLNVLYDSWDALFKISDSDVILNNGILLGEAIDDSYVIKQIPFDKERDLKYFNYFKYYQFIEITLTSAITQYNGRCDCTVSMLNTDPQRIKKLDTFSFFIQTSVVLPDTQISYAQYEYLYAEIKNIEEGTGLYVPYTGATQDVNLGFNKLSADEIYVRGLTIEEYTQGNYKISANYQDFLDLEFAEVDINGHKIVVEEDLSDYALSSDLSDYLPLVGGDMEGDINLGNYGIGFTGGSVYVDGNANMHIISSGNVILNPDEKAYVYEVTTDNEIAVKGNLPKQGLCASFSTSDFTLDTDHYIIEDVAVSNFITGSNILIITWDNCFAICPIPQSGAGRVVAAMWNSNGEAQTIRLRYELKTNNTLLDISLQGGFIPPSGHTAYVFCYKLFN